MSEAAPNVVPDEAADQPAKAPRFRMWRWFGIWLAGSALLLVWSWILSGWSGLWVVMVYAALIGTTALGLAALVFSQPWFRRGVACFGVVWLALAGLITRDARDWNRPERIFDVIVGLPPEDGVEIIKARLSPGIGGDGIGGVMFRVTPEARSNIMMTLQLEPHELDDLEPAERSNLLVLAGQRTGFDELRMRDPMILRRSNAMSLPAVGRRYYFDRASDLGFAQ